MRVPLTGVANKQIVPIHISGVNDGTATADVPFGFLIADADASRVVDKPDRTVIQGQLNQPVTSANFRDDVNRDGRIKNNDVNLVKTHRGESIPYRHYVLESSYPTPGKFCGASGSDARCPFCFCAQGTGE